MDPMNTYQGYVPVPEPPIPGPPTPGPPTPGPSATNPRNQGLRPQGQDIPEPVDPVEEPAGSDQSGSEDDEPTNSSRLRDWRECHKILAGDFGSHFHNISVHLPYYKNPQGTESRALFKSPTSTPLIKIAPDLRGSWFDPPHKEDHTDITTYWKTTKFPRKNRITPPLCPLSTPKIAPYFHIEDPALKRLFEAPMFACVDLDHSAFDVSSFDVANSAHANLDSLIRISMLNNFTVDEYLKIMIELVPKISKAHVESSEDHLHTLDLLLQVIVMAAECNQRSGQTQIATYVANKLALRDFVLARFSVSTGSATSRNILRGSSFLSDKLFGELPESFKNSLRLDNGKELRLLLKSGNPLTAKTTGKTPAAAPNKGPYKRPSNFQLHYSKKFKAGGKGGKSPYQKKQFFRNDSQKK